MFALAGRSGLTLIAVMLSTFFMQGCKTCEQKYDDCLKDCPPVTGTTLLSLDLNAVACPLRCATERLNCEYKGKMCDACKEKCSDASIGTAFDKCLQCLDTC
eukprot:GEMP01075565.1.p1 GENE.GEMP01075565.1~~GEMP01075565.1.p1  ORF type:complete len:102 (+),score=16.72 GEMP01075565.1:65-370(+)